MTINFFKYNGEKNKIHKEGQLQQIDSISGTLREGSSIVNPSILIEGDVSKFVKCNYIAIPEFGRRYFVENITSETNELFRVTAHVDVLSTYAAEIDKMDCVIRRHESQALSSGFLDDGKLMTDVDEETWTVSFPDGFANESLILVTTGG